MNCFEFSSEWAKCERGIRVFIAATVFHVQERDDILQNTALAAWKKISSFDPSRASFRTWIAGIARFECLNYINKNRKSPVIYDDSLLSSISEQTITADPAEEEELYKKLETCIKDLSPEKYNILKMKYNEHMSITEIAAVLKISEAAVKEKLYRIRRDLKDKLEACEAD